MVNPNPLSGLTLDSLSATRSAPLFTPSRTAPPEEAPVEAVVDASPPPAPAQDDTPQLELVGIVLTSDTQTALLRDASTHEMFRLASGEQYNDWQVKILDPRSVELRKGDRVQGYKMFETFGAPSSGEDVGAEPPPEPHAPPPRHSDWQQGAGDGGQVPPDHNSGEPAQDQAAPQSDGLESSDGDGSSNGADNLDQTQPEDSGAADASQEGNPPDDGSTELTPHPNFAPALGGTKIPEEGAPPEGGTSVGQ